MHSLREDTPAWLVGAAAVCAVVSIAAMEILMGAAVLALIVTRARWRVPPVWIPFAVFAILTLISLAASGHVREGLPQARKLAVYVILALVPTAFSSVRRVRWIAIGWAAAAAASSAWALNQFYNKYEDALEDHKPFYQTYVADRITGFMDHWMTFSNEMMMALLIIAALVFFGTERRWISWLTGAGALISIALILNMTRSVYLATAIGGAYLTWFWRRWVLLALPAVVGMVLLANPFQIGDRILSPLQPHGKVDSTEHRAELRRIGWEMIKAHPWLGVGPEQVWRQAKNYRPPGMAPQQSSEYYGHLENDYIQYAAERGVPAMLALMWMIGWALFDFARGLVRLRPAADQKWVLHAAIAVIVAVLVAGWFSWNLNTSTVLAMFLAVIGCGYVALKEAGDLCQV